MHSSTHPTFSYSSMAGQVRRAEGSNPSIVNIVHRLASKHKLPTTTRHTTSLDPTVLFKNHLFNYTLFAVAVAMADAETAPAEPQALSVLYCGGMFNAIPSVVPLHIWPPTIRG